MNHQRKVIFHQRVEWVEDEAVNEIVVNMRHAAIEDLVSKHEGDIKISTARCATSLGWRCRSPPCR